MLSSQVPRVMNPSSVKSCIGRTFCKRLHSRSTGKIPLFRFDTDRWFQCRFGTRLSELNHLFAVISHLRALECRLHLLFK